MAYYFTRGTTITVEDSRDIEVTDNLQPGVYTVKFNQLSGQFYLQMADPFVLPTKLYGGIDTRAERILTTFRDRPRSTGVHLSGLKGSGKTLLTTLIANRAIQEYGMAVLLVNEPYGGDSFANFLQKITTPCIVLFDEFEKVYRTNECQASILTVLDGVYPQKKLFMMTTNERERVVEWLTNRPGRIFYHYKFKGLSEEFIRDYATDILVDKTRIDEVVKYALMFPGMNFDMLKAAIEEMNRYNETFKQILEHVNIDPMAEDSPWMRWQIAYVTPQGRRVIVVKDISFSPFEFSYYGSLTLAKNEKETDALGKVSQSELSEAEILLNGHITDEYYESSSDRNQITGFEFVLTDSNIIDFNLQQKAFVLQVGEAKFVIYQLITASNTFHQFI